METRLGIVSQRRLVKEKHRLQLLEQELKAASPENLLKRGYSITLKNGKAVIDASVLQPGDELTTRFAKGENKEYSKLKNKNEVWQQRNKPMNRL